jgi:hypothetical protein
MGLEGTWYSQHQVGSKLEILPVAGGTLTGLYEVPAASGSCAKGQYPLQGRTDVGRGGSTFGFAVNWQNADTKCDSTTVWAGQYADSGDVESLTAFWVLVTASTHTSGEDRFTRVAASAGQSAGAATQQAHP